MSDNINPDAPERRSTHLDPAHPAEVVPPLTPPRGWYPDPHDSTAHRYWDGAQWTEHTAPRTELADPTADAVAATSAQVSSTEPVDAAVGAAAPTKKPWYRRKAVVIPVSAAAALILFVGIVGSLNRPNASPAADDEPAAKPAASAEPAAEESAAEEEPEAAGPVDLELGETAFGVDIEQGTGWYAVQVTNPNVDYVFGFADISVEAYDSAGVLLDSDSNYTTILSGESWYVGTFFDIGSATIDHLEVRGPVATEATFAAAAETGSMTVENIVTGSEYDWLTVTGQLVSNFSEDQDMVRIDLVARDGAGKIVGVDHTYTDRVPAGGTVAWETSYWEVPLDATVSAYPHL